MKRIWITGGLDTEMTIIERLLLDCGETVVPAMSDGRRVHPGNAYRADPITIDDPSHTLIYLVECLLPVIAGDTGEQYSALQIIIDHHRPGDPGYGVPPAEYLRGSSLGQVVAELQRLGAPVPECWGVVGTDAMACIPRGLRFAAAADHCLGAAYAGECPGVDPADLAVWRVEQRAAHQGRSVEVIHADIEAAKDRLRSAPLLDIGAREQYGCDYHHDHTELLCPECIRTAWIADLRGEEIPELPEAACQLGVAFLATPRPGPDGRRKVVLQCARPEHLAAWPAWAAANGIVDCYGGDPARGFAGGYDEN